MADIPPIAASSVQAGYTQAEAGKVKDAAEAANAHAAGRNMRAINDAGAIIETSEQDTAIFADAEGSGGKGRQEQEESNDDFEHHEQKDSGDGISTDDKGIAHVDIEA